MSKLLIGSDHGGYELKEKLIEYLKSKDIAYEDLGCYNKDLVHYPDYSKELVHKIETREFEKGVLICGTGIGMSIAANRSSAIRATLCKDHFTAMMARKHNNSNVLILGARVTGDEICKDILNTWLTTDFEDGRHQTRLDMIDN